MNEQKPYTAEELRQQAHDFDEVLTPKYHIREVGAMLRQAADTEDEVMQLKARLEAVVKLAMSERWRDNEDQGIPIRTCAKVHNAVIDTIVEVARGEGGAE